MLKSMGLWKSSPIPAALLTEGDYKVDAEGKLQPVGSEYTIISQTRRRYVLITF